MSSLKCSTPLDVKFHWAGFFRQYLCFRTQWCKQDKMSWIKNVWHFPRTGWPRSGWPLSTTLCYKSFTELNHHTELLLIFYLIGSDTRKKYWKFHNDTINSFGVMGKGNAIVQPYFHVTMSHFKFSYFLNSCPHKIEVLEQFIDFWSHSKYGFIWFIGHLMQITWKMTKLWHFTKKLISLHILAKT